MRNSSISRFLDFSLRLIAPSWSHRLEELIRLFACPCHLRFKQLLLANNMSGEALFHDVHVDALLLWVLSPTRHLVRHVHHLVRDRVEMLLLAVCSVAIHLVHVNANLFLSLKIDQCRVLSRLSLDFTELFATAGYTLYFVSAVL